MEEFEDAWQEFFKDKTEPASEEESLEQQQEFVHWYNTERKQSDTGLTPEEMGDGILEFSTDEPYDDPLDEAEYYLDHGMYDEAKEIVKDILGSEPKNNDALFLLVQANLMEGTLVEAEEIIDMWDEYFPDDPFKYIQQAQVHIIRLDFQMALESIDKALKIDPDLFDAVITKAQILSFMEDDGYEEFIEKAREIDEERTERFMEEHWIEENLNLELDDTHFTKLQKIVSLLESDDTEKARELVSEIKNQDPSEEIIDALGRIEIEILLLEGKEEEVEEKITKQMKENPEDTFALYYSARMSYSKGEIKDALDTINKCIKIAEENDEEPFEYYALKAEILKSTGDGEWKKWSEKAIKNHEKSFEEMKERFEELGISHEIDEEIIEEIRDEFYTDNEDD